MSHFTYLVDQAKGMGAKLVSVFGYGEPLLDKYIVERVKYCADKELETFITTNASLLDLDLAARLLSAGLSKMRFSVHGVYDNYNSVHRGLEYEKVIRNVSNFIAMNRDRYKKSCDVSVSVIPMSGETVDDILHIWGETQIEIWKPHNWGQGREYRKSSKKRKKTCGRVHSGPVQIQADGNVIPCCFLTNGEIILGNTYKNTIEEILKATPYERLRENHERGEHKGLACETCDQLNEGDTALLYSTVDPSCQIGKTSSTKFKLREK